jgi:putative flavoprotein involved in K+ transport
MSGIVRTERVQVVVIGAGQAGLSVGYHLAQRGIQFVILEARERIGDSWRERWDSLRLFTTGRLDGLDGMPFPAPGHRFPTKDEMAAYLEAYAIRFRLPVRTGVRVTGLTRRGDRYLVSAGDLCFEADHVVVAMATYQEPRIPAFAAELAPEIRQLHSREYRRPGQLQPGGVLVVGAGNSGAEIALEAVRTGHETWLSGRDTGKVPFRIDTVLSRYVLQPLLLRVIFHRLLTVDTPMGRKARPKIISSGGPLIRTKPKDLIAAGVRRVPRTAGIKDGRPVLEDGTVLDVTNVVWCTGFHPGFSWIDLPVLDEHGEPKHERGLLPQEPGLSFVGLHFLYSMSSTMIHGVGRDAERIAEAVEQRLMARARRRQPTPVAAA